MLAYLSSWIYDTQPKADSVACNGREPKEDTAVHGFARYATASAPKPPASFVTELGLVKLRHVEHPPRPSYFPPRDPVMRQLLATRARVM